MNGKRILLVEDDRLVAAGLAAGLIRHGYVVATATSGEEALEMIAASAPDLVLMDICLPGIDGIEAARMIGEQYGVPVIFLTALDDDARVRAAISEGGLGYLVKPISVKQLMPSVAMAIARASDLSWLKEQEENLEIALKQGRDTSVAIGILMERHRLTAEDAFETLRSRARETRRKTADVARDVVSGALNLAPPGRC